MNKTLINWLKENWVFTIGGVIFIPLSVVLLLALVIGSGYAGVFELRHYLLFFLLCSYSLFYFVCLTKARRKIRIGADPGYLDIFPILYFVVLFLLTVILGS